MQTIRVTLAVATLVLAGCGGGGEQGGAGEVPPDVTESVKAAIVERIHAYNDTIPIAHPESGERVELVFGRVHEEVEATRGGRFVACVDFLDADSTLWDVDYYVDDEDGGYVVEDVLIHEMGGEDVIPEGARRRLETKR